MVSEELEVKYNPLFIQFIKDKLLGNQNISIPKIMNMCGEFYNLFLNKYNRIPSVEIYNDYPYKSSYWLKKFIIISVSINIDFPQEKEYINYNLGNDKNCRYFGFDTINNLFCSEKSFYFIYDLFSSNLADKLSKFASFIDIITVYYDEESSSFYVSTTPKEEDIFKDDIINGSLKETFSINRIHVPKWLYCKKPEDLTINDYITLNNADVKAEFVKKAGIDKLLSLGKVVDSYENYPENEWWAKSEYKLIDMHKVVPPKKIRYKWLNTTKLEPWTYAPFLYMKNQTTGVIHLEGINPKCQNLYDALKMRYKGLNLPKFEIKNIK